MTLFSGRGRRMVYLLGDDLYRKTCQNPLLSHLAWASCGFWAASLPFRPLSLCFRALPPPMVLSARLDFAVLKKRAQGQGRTHGQMMLVNSAISMETERRCVPPTCQPQRPGLSLTIKFLIHVPSSSDVSKNVPFPDVRIASFLFTGTPFAMIGPPR
mmetsp:Transcript_15876/g.30041  ORF Transcript_15876/g.30041 Transcript_15876/m.30041 type:complete len:157 (-) Transcript_15876:890-1360(-)